MEELVADDDLGEPLLLHDFLGSVQEDAATRAGRRMDWQEFMAGLTKRDQAIIHCLVEGKQLSSLAPNGGFKSSTFSGHGY